MHSFCSRYFLTFTDIKEILRTEQRLEGAVLKISNPPVCNSILVTGLTKNTTREAIEFYFENEQNGGGKIYGDIIHQKAKGKAVVSFCDPQGNVKHGV
jgi:predicted RNase H-like HicB family nuclease